MKATFGNKRSPAPNTMHILLGIGNCMTQTETLRVHSNLIWQEDHSAQPKSAFQRYKLAIK